MSFLLLTLLGCPAPTDTGAPGDTADSADTGEVAALPADFPATLTEVGGCGDLEVYAHDPADTVRIEIVTEIDLVADACSGPQSVTITLPDPRVAIVAEVGSELDSWECTDDPDGHPDVDRAWTATAGTITFDVTTREPDACRPDSNADAVVTLDTVVFTPDDGGADTATISSAAYSAMVGWLAG